MSASVPCKGSHPGLSPMEHTKASHHCPEAPMQKLSCPQSKAWGHRQGGSEARSLPTPRSSSSSSSAEEITFGVHLPTSQARPSLSLRGSRSDTGRAGNRVTSRSSPAASPLHQAVPLKKAGPSSRISTFIRAVTIKCLAVASYLHPRPWPGFPS